MFDTDGNPQTSFRFSLPFESSKEFDLQIVCRTNLFLKSVNGANVFYYGKFEEEDDWTPLDEGLDLSAFNGQMKVIHIKVETDETDTPSQQVTRLFETIVNG